MSFAQLFGSKKDAVAKLDKAVDRNFIASTVNAITAEALSETCEQHVAEKKRITGELRRIVKVSAVRS